MPRTTIELPYAVEYLSILDEEGNVDSSLDPKLNDELLLQLYRTMLLARRFDERLLALQRQGRIGTYGPIKGQEAALPPPDPLAMFDYVYAQLPPELEAHRQELAAALEATAAKPAAPQKTEGR